MTNAALRGKPDAGNPHVRFDEGEVASAATPRRGSLLYKHSVVLALIAAIISSAASAGKVRVACVGDSITSGYALDNPERGSYPAQLQRLLGDGYEVANFGRPGLGVYRHQQRKGSSIAWEYSKAYAATLEFKPDILVAGLGANDWREHMKEFLPGTNGAPQVARGTFCAQYVDLLRRLKVANPEMRLIVWTKLTPLGSKHITYGSPAPFVLREDLAKVADAVGAEPIDVFTELYPMRETGLAKDGIHPDPEMAGCLARIVARAIMPKGALRSTLHPMATYDKIYKNFGFGDGIFSWNRWCRRQQQKEAK